MIGQIDPGAHGTRRTTPPCTGYLFREHDREEECPERLACVIQAVRVLLF